MSKEKTTNTAVRLSENLLIRADAIAAIQNEAAFVGTVSRSDVLRAAIELGLKALEEKIIFLE